MKSESGIFGSSGSSGMHLVIDDHGGLDLQVVGNFVLKRSDGLEKILNFRGEEFHGQRARVCHA